MTFLRTGPWRSTTTVDDNASRVAQVVDEKGLFDVTLAEYAYLGVGQLVGTNYPEPADEVFYHLHGTTSGSYPGLDDFNRVVSCVWSKDVTNGPIDFYDVDVSYDRVSNVRLIEDNVYTGWDVDYTMDGLDRLTQADSGTWSGSAITSQTRQEVWELDLVGNWDRNKLDLDGDLDYADADEFNVTGTFNDVNEQTDRGGDTLVYNAVGELTSNGVDQKFVWDAFGRLRKVTDLSDVLIAQYRYNGLNERIAWQYDTDGDASVETSNSNDDPWFYFLNDLRWRPVATITAIDVGAIEAGEYLAKADSKLKEAFVFHAAGLDGQGGSSYIDSVILRDADMNGNGGWGFPADGGREHRSYYCQNWRADVVALLDETGARREGARYFAYGMPFGLPRADCNADGIVDSTDASIISAANGYSVGDANYDVRADLDLDGSVDSTEAAIQTADNGQTLGLGNLSRDPTLSGGIGNRIGYAGYQWDPSASTYHVRNRVLNPLTGRWLRRDPGGYVDGASLYEYVMSAPLSGTDPMGLLEHQVRPVCKNPERWNDGETAGSGDGTSSLCPCGLSRGVIKWCIRGGIAIAKTKCAIVCGRWMNDPSRPIYTVRQYVDSPSQSGRLCCCNEVTYQPIKRSCPPNSGCPTLGGEEISNVPWHDCAPHLNGAPVTHPYDPTRVFPDCRSYCSRQQP